MFFTKEQCTTNKAIFQRKLYRGGNSETTGNIVISILSGNLSLDAIVAVAAYSTMGDWQTTEKWQIVLDFSSEFKCDYYCMLRLTAPKLMIIPTTTIVTTAHIGEQVLKLYWYILMRVDIIPLKTYETVTMVGLVLLNFELWPPLEQLNQ